jgi:acetyl esterase/lipase
MISTSHPCLLAEETGPRPAFGRVFGFFDSPKNGIGARVFLDVPYQSDAEDRHKLDLYLPDRRMFPVVVFAHGGAWVSGNKALHGHLGSFLAKHGIGTVLVNYRLAPQVRHPAPALDLARAFAWTHKHIGEFGGDTKRLYLCGHSAGGHLASLLGTDETFLAGEGLGFEQVRGVIAISGVYKIHWNVTLARLGFVFQHTDKTTASPFWNVKSGCPSFLLLVARKDLWTLSRQAFQFHRRLLYYNCRSRLVVVPAADHDTILQTVSLPTAGHGQAIVKFIQEA